MDRLGEPLVVEGLLGREPLGAIAHQQLADKVHRVLRHGIEGAVLERVVAGHDVVHGGHVVVADEGRQTGQSVD